MEEESTQLIFVDLVRGCLAKVRQLPNCSEVTVMSPLANAGQMQIIAHALVKWTVEASRVSHQNVSLLREKENNKETLQRIPMPHGKTLN